MSNILDSIADGIANAIGGTGSDVEAVTPEVEKTLPLGKEPTEAIGVSRGFGDLKRFLLPSYTNPLYPGQTFDGSSNLVGRFWPRRIQDAINVRFPSPIYGIWLDPTWTSPGAQIGIAGSGATRGNYIVLHRGDGVRFTEPVENLNVLNLDGLEQTLDLSKTANIPYGYVSFLIGTSKDSIINVNLDKKPLNVSSCIQNFALTNASSKFPQWFVTLPTNPNLTIPVVATHALSKVFINVVGVNTQVLANGGFSATLVPWFMSTLPVNPTGPVEAIDVLGNTYQGYWTKGRPITLSCTSVWNLQGGSELRGGAAHKAIDIPPGSYMMALTMVGNIVPENSIIVAGNTNTLAIEVHGQ